MEIRPLGFQFPVFKDESPKKKEETEKDLYDIDLVVENNPTDSHQPKPVDTYGTHACTEGCSPTEVCSSSVEDCDARLRL